MKIRSRALTFTATALLVLSGLVALSAPAQAAAGLTATFTQTSYGSWWMGKFIVKNPTSAAINGWTLEFQLPAATKVDGHWNGTATTKPNNAFSVANAYYNGNVAAGRDTEPYSYYFISSSPMSTPLSCRINGNKCDGGTDAPPGAPTNVTVGARTTTRISLSWTAPAPGDFPITGYDVYADGALKASVDTTSATLTGLTPNTSYQLTVKSKDSRGNVSAASAPVTGATRNPADDTTPPTVPGNLRSPYHDSVTVSLAWDASTDAGGLFAYEVYVNGTLNQTVTGTTAKVVNLAPSTPYQFTVKARDIYDNVSAATPALSVTTDDPVGNGNYARVGYFAQWGIYGRQFFVRNLHTSGAAAKMTHLNYAFTNLNQNTFTCMNGVTKGTTANPQDPDQGTGAGDAEADYSRGFSAAQSVDGVADTGWEPLRGNFNQLKKLKAKYPNLKVMMSIGGWTYSKFFHDAALTPERRQAFAASCIDLYIKGNLPSYNGAGGAGSAAGVFDGLDLDWEWPGAEGHPGNHWSAEDKANNTLLIAEFRRQMEELTKTTGKHYQLTAFTPADPAKIATGWDITTNDGNPSVFDYLDFANVQGYDFHGAGSDNSWEPNRTGHASNQNTDAQDPYNFHFSVVDAIKPYIDAGVNPRKLTIGVPFYGRGWQGVADGGVHGEWQSATGAAPGQFPEEAGTRGYANLLASVPNCTVYHDEQSLSTYCYTGNNGQWWTFDDPWLITKKMAWLKSKGLLGVMIWEMSGDNGTLMTAIDNGLK
ncbi:chitinase [Actinorhabdospora filicis]|uniref:chitinase n=1 Tax=Actinorhabdospora filicis TaxID=1785913 RepID=A0A9W6SGA8_9ACTN|nr:glycosyl hydrolase family 18 protein [Actinorhabdospora filicis]GLZ75477.1 chitinase [Actinorhabdospora filicis]